MCLKIAPGAGAQHDRYVGIRGMYVRTRTVRIDLEVDLGLRRVQSRQPRQEKLAGEERGYPQSQRAAPRTGAQLAGRRVQPFEKVFDLLQIARTSIGQRKGACAAVKEGDSKLLLERPDLVAHGGRGQE